jgi:hypothetical protein
MDTRSPRLSRRDDGRNWQLWEGRWCLRGADVALGDDLVFLGTPHRIVAFEVYDPTRIGLPKADGWRIAYGAVIKDKSSRFGITLDPNGRYEILA